MSGKLKVLSIALASMALTFYSATTKADVTGSFSVSSSFNPIQCQDLYLFNINYGIDQPCEKTLWKLDFETELNVNITISGLTMGLHAHTGVTGFEDIILRFTTMLGALDIKDEFVFAQPFKRVILKDGERIPTCLVQTPGGGSCLTLFVKKRVEAKISLDGVVFKNLAIFEDVNFPSPSATKRKGETYNQDLQRFGFGDVIIVKGQTPSGITVKSETGICAEPKRNKIKEHSWDFKVNPECAQPAHTQKPPLFFDFERLYVSDIPLAAGLTLDLAIECVMPKGPICEFKGTWEITGSIFELIQVETTIEGKPLGGAGTSFDITVKAGGPLSLELVIDPATMDIIKWSATASFTLNSASLKLSASGRPGISSLSAKLSISRYGLTFSADLDYDVNPTSQQFDFDDLTVGLKTQAGVITAKAEIIIKEMNKVPEGSYLPGANLDLEVSF